MSGVVQNVSWRDTKAEQEKERKSWSIGLKHMGLDPKRKQRGHGKEAKSEEINCGKM